MEPFIQLNPLPTPPTTSDPSSFRVRADSFLSTLPAWSGDINTLSEQINARTSLISGAMNFAGEWSAGMTALAGYSYIYQGDVWVCAEDTDTAPSPSNTLYTRIYSGAPSPANLVINGSLRVDQYVYGDKTYSNLLGYYTDGVYAGNKNNGSLKLSHSTITLEGVAYPSVKGEVVTPITSDVGLATIYVGRIEANDISAYSTGDLTFSALVEVSHAGEYGLIFKKRSSAPKAFAAAISLIAGVNKVNIVIPGDSAFVPAGISSGFDIVLSAKHLTEKSTSTLGWQDDTSDIHQYAPGFAWWGIAGATIAIADISLVPGTVASQKAWPPISEELARCQRYCEVTGADIYFSTDTVRSNESASFLIYYSEKRSIPSIDDLASTPHGAAYTLHQSFTNRAFYYLLMQDTADHHHSLSLVVRVGAEL